jgi:hypothetical protein
MVRLHGERWNGHYTQHKGDRVRGRTRARVARVVAVNSDEFVSLILPRRHGKRHTVKKEKNNFPSYTV